MFQVRNDEDWDCFRADGENLVETWLSNNPQGKYVETASELNNIDVNNFDKIFGLFAKSHVAFDDEVVAGKDPTLTEMTTKAVEVCIT